MKHRSKKKSHAGGHHGKSHKHHKHGGGEATTSSHGNGDATPHTTTTPRRKDDAPAAGTAESTGSSHRGSLCEYCGAGALDASSPVGGDDDTFDCADDCERFSLVDVNSVTCSTAYELRAPHLTAFYCQSGLVLGEVQTLIRAASSGNGGDKAVSDDAVIKLRPKVLALFAGVMQLSVDAGYSSPYAAIDPEDNDDNGGGREGAASSPTCPFVTLLSVLMPTLHKLFEWIQLTKPAWWVGAVPATPPLSLLASQLELHDLLAHVVAEGDRLYVLVEENEERDQDITRLVEPQPPTPRRSGSSSFSSSSSLHSSQSRPGSATGSEWETRRLPQVKRISFEFEELLAEFKFELAELSEIMVENVEAVGLQLSRLPQVASTPATTPPLAPKTRSSANEFVELLLQHVLTPLAERVVASPSLSRSYIFPRIVDRCVGVTTDEYAVENGKWTESAASHFEKASELFRAWSLQTDAEYDRQLIAAPRDVPRLALASLDAFRRLDSLLHTWARAGKDSEPYVPRLTFRTNLETLRSTLKRTITARTNAASGTSALSGITTPPPQ